MRIAQVVTFLSEDGAFGGPVSVARAQSVELARRGHDVTLLAGWDGRALGATHNVDVRLGRVRRVAPTPGFSGIFAPKLLAELWRLRHDLDIVHVHLARDLVTLPVAALARILRLPVITQTHGMIIADSRIAARVMDFVFTRRVLRNARTALYLTETEQIDLEQVAGCLTNTVFMPNGVEIEERNSIDATRTPIVLFCARLHPRKRVLAFAEMARLLVDRGVRATFIVAGPDEGDLAPLIRFIEDNNLEGTLRYVGAIPPQDVRGTLAKASVFVLPSEREPFPMTLLESLAEGTPAVITNGCMMAEQVSERGASVTNGSPEALAGAVHAILSIPGERTRLSSLARDTAVQQYDIRGVVDRLVLAYRQQVSI